MNRLKKIAIIILIIGSLALFGYKLRTKNYATVPFPGQSIDEYSYAWVGMSFIEVGYPVGIGGIPTDPFRDFRYINVDRIFSSSTVHANPIPITYPFFYQPPLTGLITGGFAYLKHARVFEDATTAIIRKPVILISTAVLLLIFWLGRLAVGTPVGIMAMTMMAFSPLMVINSRMVQAENFMLPMFLLSVIALTYYLKKRGKRWLLYLTAIFAGIGVLFKFSAVSIAVADMSLLLVSDRKWKNKIQDGIVFTVIFLGFLSLFTLMGYVYDWPLFVKTFIGNSERTYGIGFQSIYELITTSKVTGNVYLTDGWITAGWLSIGYLFIKNNFEKYKLILLPFVAYLGIYILFGSESFGWYRIPLYPFIFLSTAIFLWEGYKKLSLLFPSLIMMAIPIGVALNKLTAIHKMDLPVSLWRLGLPMILIGSVLAYYFKDRKSVQVAGKIIWICFFLGAIWLSYKYSNAIDVSYWYKVN